ELMQAAKDVFGDTGQLGLIVMIGAIDNAGKQISDTAAKTTQAVQDTVAESVASATKTRSKDKLPQVSPDVRKELDRLRLQSNELDARAQQLRQQASKTRNKAEAQKLRDDADRLKQLADELDTRAKHLEFTEKWGEDYESILPTLEGQTQKMEPAGVSLMEKLQAGLARGWGNIQKDLRDMANELGQAFGIEDIGGKWDDAAEKSKFNDIPKDFMEATGKQFMSD
ncbi:hypothetical protein ACW9HQ_43955, partial [Nocardia gipuzkoensis]